MNSRYVVLANCLSSLLQQYLKYIFFLYSANSFAFFFTSPIVFLVLWNISFLYLLCRFSVCLVLLLLLRFNIFHHFLEVFLFPLIPVVTTNLSFESLALDHTTSAFLLEATLYILSYPLYNFDCSMSLQSFINHIFGQ